MSAPDSGRKPLAPASPAEAMGSAPRRGDELVFSAPWEARAFALAVLAHRSGLFEWPEWTNALGEALKEASVAAEADRDAVGSRSRSRGGEGIGIAEGAEVALAEDDGFKAFRSPASSSAEGFGSGEYYHCWLSALERILVAGDSLSEEELLRRRGQWRRAAQRTPHGEPVELRSSGDANAPRSEKSQARRS